MKRTFLIITLGCGALILLLALMDNGVEAVRSRVGVEATGKPFDGAMIDKMARLHA